MSPGQQQPFASVVVVTRNRAAFLDNALAALGRLDYPAYEVVVVDHSSEDTTPEVAERHGARRIVCPPDYGIGRCRQCGVNAAQGEVTVMCDDDCVPAVDWLATLVRRLEAEPDLGMVGGLVVNHGFPPHKRYKGRTRTIGPNGVIGFAADPEEAEFFGNANVAYRTRAIRRVGGYDPFFFTGEEIDLALSFRRAGYRVAYEPGARVDHYFTGIDHKRGRLFWGSELMRLYRYLKHSPPRGAAAWTRFWRDELRLLAGDLRRSARRFASGLIRRRGGRLTGALVDGFNAVSARLAVPWLLRRARTRRTG